MHFDSYLLIPRLLACCRKQTMASSFTVFQGPILRKTRFLGQNYLLSNSLHKQSCATHKRTSTFYLIASAKFDLFQIMGGRGLLNGEQGLEQELKRNTLEQTSPEAVGAAKEEESGSSSISITDKIADDAFEKELLGLTGGFPGGEKGLRTFLEKNPPPKKSAAADSGYKVEFPSSKKPKAPELPLLMPGMIAIVKNTNNPFYMYCGIVQRITDGRAGVLFEGGNWDRLVTFRLEELERREKGPPMKNPKSCILEPPIELKS